jgi:S-(hydroxymethyl)glutathione dehydrogenase / alcohol dehydrogenase
MKAAVLYESPGRLEIEHLVLDTKLEPREVHVRISYSGLCHSDLHFIDGDLPTEVPIVLGHEAAGVVEAVGDAVTYVQPGDHVISCLSTFCGECRYCLSGRPSICSGRAALRARPRPALTSAKGEPVAQLVGLGAFAEEMVVHEHTLAKVRQDMPLDVAALLGCGVITGIGAVLRTAKIEPGSSAVVVGCGGIGLAAVQGASLAGASPIIAVDVSDEKLKNALEGGATHTVNATRDDPVLAVREISGGGVNYSFEAIGRKQTVEQAVAMLGPGGTATIIGVLPAGASIEIPINALQGEKRLQTSSMGSNRFRTDLPWLCDLYLQGRLKLDEFVTARRPLEEINEGYDEMRVGRGVRTLMAF